MFPCVYVHKCPIRAFASGGEQTKISHTVTFCNCTAAISGYIRSVAVINTCIVSTHRIEHIESIIEYNIAGGVGC